MVMDNNQKILWSHHQSFDEVLTDDPIKIGRRLQKLLVEEPAFKNTYQSTFINYGSIAYTLVPEAFFAESSQRAYLEQVTSLAPADKVMVDPLPFMGANLVFAIDKGVQFLFEVHFPKAKIHHVNSSWLHAIDQYTKQQQLQDSLFFAHISKGVLQVAIIENGHLKFTNHFLYDQPEDFRYFIFLIFDQFKLSPERVPIYLSGAMNTASTEYQAIYPYVQTLNFVQDFTAISIDPAVPDAALAIQRDLDLVGLSHMTRSVD